MRAAARVFPAAVSALLLAAVVLLVLQKASGDTPIYVTWFEPTINAVVFGVLATVLLHHGTAPRMAVVFVSIALVAVVQVVAGEYATFAREVQQLPGADAMALISEVDTLLILPLINLLLLLYPDGRPQSRRWRLMVWLTLGCAAIHVVVVMLKPGGYEDVPGYSNPLGVTGFGPITHAVDGWVVRLEFAIMIVAMLGVAIRYRRANSVVRQQLKWFALAVAVFLFVAIFLIGLSRHLPRWAPHVTFGLGVMGFALATGFAILRYRLYDIDRVISRTVSYAVVTGLLLCVYVICVTVITRVLPSTSSIGVAASTLAVAALFRPLRRRVQTRVDRRFNRARYDAERTVDSFSRRLRGEVDLEAVRRDLLGVVNQTMEPTLAQVWLRESRLAAR